MTELSDSMRKRIAAAPWWARRAVRSTVSCTKPVLLPAAGEELAAHASLLEAIARESKGACLWGVEQGAV